MLMVPCQCPRLSACPLTSYSIPREKTAPGVMRLAHFLGAGSGPEAEVPDRHYASRQPAKNGPPGRKVRAIIPFLNSCQTWAFRGCRLQLVCRPQRVIRSKPGHRTVQSHRKRSSGTTHDYRKDYLLPSKNNLEDGLDLDLRSLMKAFFSWRKTETNQGKFSRG